jgi:hypothetical protein
VLRPVGLALRGFDKDGVISDYLPDAGSDAGSAESDN